CVARWFDGGVLWGRLGGGSGAGGRGAGPRMRVRPAEIPPPAYTVVPETARDSTVPLASGFQGVALFVSIVASSAAIRFRACPPTAVKAPAAYTRLPDTARAETVPFPSGFQAETRPSART